MFPGRGAARSVSGVMRCRPGSLHAQSLGRSRISGASLRAAPRPGNDINKSRMTSSELPKTAVAEHLAQKICALDAAHLPKAVRVKCEELLIDVVGLAVTARNEDYVKSALAGCDDDGPCTVIGHGRGLSAAGAALVNGTASHGEDFGDTFEGGPVHAGAVIVPAVLAACERHELDGGAALLGIAAGVEKMCRLKVVAPPYTLKTGFHPTAVFGAVGATAGVGAAL